MSERSDQTPDLVNRLFDPGPEVQSPVALGPPKPPKPTFNVSVETRVELDFDLARFLFERLDDYVAFTGYEDDPADRILDFIARWLDNEINEPFFWAPSNTVVEGFPTDPDYDFSYLSESEAVAIHKSLGLNDEGTKKLQTVVKYPVWY